MAKRRPAMPRLVPNRQALVDQLHRLLAHPSATEPSAGTEERILDAALAAFSARGIRATTMSQIARDAGISREWLYKHFRNRDAVVVAVARREAMRFVEGLGARAVDADDFAGAATDAFVYAVEFLRDHELLQRVLSTEPDVISPGILADAAPVIAMAVRAGAGYLSALGDVSTERAEIVAETIVRLAASIAIVPSGALDLHEPAALRRYADAVIPAILQAEPAPIRRRTSARSG